MRRAYAELLALNTAAAGEVSKRAANHAALMQALRRVNEIIQKAARLRSALPRRAGSRLGACGSPPRPPPPPCRPAVGGAKQRVVAACRAAVKAGNMQALAHIIRQGYPPGERKPGGGMAGAGAAGAAGAGAASGTGALTEELAG